MDDQYGRGNWDKIDPEYRWIQKYGDRNFRDPRSILLPDDTGIMGQFEREGEQMTGTDFALWHIRTDDRGCDDEKMLGV